MLVGEDARLGKKLLDHIKSTGQGEYITLLFCPGNNIVNPLLTIQQWNHSINLSKKCLGGKHSRGDVFGVLSILLKRK